MANYPHPNHRFCAAADEGHDRIYTVGGWTTAYRNNSYYYNVKANYWSSMPNLKYMAYNIGCGITTMRGSGNRFLIVTGVIDAFAQYYDLTSGYQWVKLATQNARTNLVSIVSLTPSEAYQVGGWTETHSYHTRNWWLWNPSSYKYEDHGLNMARQHVGGDWTRIPEDAWMLRTCSIL